MAGASQLLEHELDVCDETSLRLLLKNICAEIPAARTLALELLALDEYEEDVATDSETLVVEETGNSGGLGEDRGSRKRKAEDISRDDEEGHVGGMSRGPVGLGGNTMGVDLGREVGLAAPRSIGVVEQRIRDLEKSSGLQGTPVVVLSDSEEDDLPKLRRDEHHYDDEEEEEYGEEEEYEEDFNENEFSCRFCGETYNEDENDDEACCTHDEGTYISGDCPLSKEDQAKLPDDSEWHVYACCGEPANEEGNGCRSHAHAPDRGMGY